MTKIMLTTLLSSQFFKTLFLTRLAMQCFKNTVEIEWSPNLQIGRINQLAYYFIIAFSINTLINKCINQEASATGTVNMNWVPLPYWLSTIISDWCNSTIFFTIASPSPVPSFCPEPL